MPQSEITQIILAIVPVALTALVAILTNKQVIDLKDKMAAMSRRIAILETILTDHNIPIPPDTFKMP